MRLRSIVLKIDVLRCAFNCVVRRLGKLKGIFAQHTKRPRKLNGNLCNL
jgi:hypothetical protein